MTTTRPSSTRDAWTWPAHQRRQVTNTAHLTPQDMLIRHGKAKPASRKCGDCFHFTPIGTGGSRCARSCTQGASLSAGHYWKVSWTGCGLWTPAATLPMTPQPPATLL